MLERPLIQTGFLTVRNGSFVEALAESRIPGDLQSLPKPQLRNVTTKDHQSLVVHGNACLGSDCTAAGSFPLTLQEDAPTLFFDAGGPFSPNRDWRLQANDFIGGGEYFALWDLTAGTVPFRVEGGAPDLALYVRSNGNVGLGTSTPAVRLDVKASAAGQATERLQNSSATGYSGTEYLDNTGNVDLFFGVDNAASTTRLNSVNNNPIVILTNSVERMRITPTLLNVASGEVRIPGGTASANGWPTHFNWPIDGRNYIRGTTLIADDGGSVGIGTNAPSSKLHVNGGDIRVSGGSFMMTGSP